MGLSAARAAVLIALSLGAALADKRAQVTEACIEGECSAAPQPLKGQSILQVNSLDHNSAPVPADLVEEEEADSEVVPRKALKKGALNGEKKKRKSIKGKVLLQTEGSRSKGAPVEEDKIKMLRKHAQDVRSSDVDDELPMHIPNPMAVREDVLVSSRAASVITPEEEEEILKHIKRAEDIGLFDKQEMKSSHPELAEINKVEAWAKFQELGHLGDGQKAYEKVQNKGRISEYLKARELFKKNSKKAVKTEIRRARANALVQMGGKKSKAQLHSEDKANVELEAKEQDKFASNLHICEEEEKAIMARIERAKAAGSIRPSTKESLENIKEQVRHVAILQKTMVTNAKARNLALLQTVSGNVSGSEDASHGKSGQDMLNAIAAAAEEELTAEEQQASEESSSKEKLLPPDDASVQGVLLQNASDSEVDMSKFHHMKAEYDTKHAQDMMDHVAEVANANLSAAEQEAAQDQANSNRMLPPEASPNTASEESRDGDPATQRIVASVLQVDKNLEGKAGAEGNIFSEDPPRPHANKDFYDWIAEREEAEMQEQARKAASAQGPPGSSA